MEKVFTHSVYLVSNDEYFGSKILNDNLIAIGRELSFKLNVDIGDGASCHVGYKSCFYRTIPLGKIKDTEKLEMKFSEKKKKFDPKIVYKGKPNPTKV